jgi:NAD(P)-dependent dehydrogenase (short-subunit alcohol dehydrogenase family)
MSEDQDDTTDGAMPMADVEGKVAFVTGASSGIGLGIARAFVGAGMKVVVGYRTPHHRDEAMQHLELAGRRVHAISVDVTDRKGMERAAAETIEVFGKIHVLVNNAGVFATAPLVATTYDDWDWMMGINVNGVFNGIRAFLPHMRAQREGGQIVTTSSVFGLFTMANFGAYSATKFAVVAMMEALRAELANENIGVSVFLPGVVNSNVIESSRNRPATLGDTAFKLDAATIARDKEARRDPNFAMDALEAGQLVLRGTRRNDLYIFTHPEFEPITRDRNEALSASIPRDLQPTARRVAVVEGLLQKSIYAKERDRQRRASRVRGRHTPE